MLSFGWSASPVGYFFSIVAPSVNPTQHGHQLIRGWLKVEGLIPALNIEGWNISLAGLVLPLLLSLFLLRGQRLADLPRSAVAALVASLVCNVLLVMQQSAQGFPGGGVHLITFIPALLLLDAPRVVWFKHRPEYIANPRMLGTLVGLSFLSILPVDAFASMLMSWQVGGDPLRGLQWVGGAGWHDGLLLSVLLTAGGGVVVWFAHRLSSKPTDAHRAAPFAA